MLMAEAMNVSYIRVQDIRLDFDNSNIYISATLLDRTPYAGTGTSISFDIFDNFFPRYRKIQSTSNDKNWISSKRSKAIV